MFRAKVTNLKSIIIMLHIADPDCYKLVSMSKVRTSTKLEPTSPIRTTTNETLYQ